MGEQVATKEEANNKEESPAPEAAPAPPEEKKDEAPPPPPPADQDPNKEEAAPPPPPPPPVPVPVILGVEVHCTGCAKRIRRSLLRCKGVEAVHVDMPANQVTIKGAVDPQALLARLRAKTKRDATLISPLPPPPPPEGEEPPPPAPPLVSEARTVELLVNMHCEACAQQLQSKMMKMKGVVSAQTDLAAGRLTLSATVPDEKIVEYIHRRTGKIASVVPPPPPEPPKEGEPPAADAEPPKEEAPADADGKKEEAGENKPAEDGKGAAEAGEEKKEGAGEEDQKPGKQEGVAVDGFPPEEMMKRMVYWPYGGAPGGGIHYKLHPADAEEAMMARRMAMHAMPPPPHHHHHNPYAMMHQQWAPPPPPPPPAMPMYNSYNYGGSSYMMERPPQMFSDENPNACVIS